MVKRRVGIITPMALSSVPIEYSESYLANVAYLQAHAKELPFELTDVRRIAPTTFPIDANRNECIAWIRKWDIDISIWFDADQELINFGTPEREPDILFRLLRDGFEHPLYAGIYYLKKPPYHPIVFTANKTFKEFRPIWVMPEKELFYADMIGMGCCKIDRSVIDKLDHPYFYYNTMPKSLAGLGDLARFKYENNVGDVSEDVGFWRQVKKKHGKRIVIDPKIQVGHVTRAVITPQVFRMQMEVSLEEIKKEKSQEEFDKWWAEVEKAELYDPGK